MRAGGTTNGSLWLTRVHSLRPGDWVRIAHWVEGGMWLGGEPLIVLEEPVRLPKTEYRATGYFDVRVQVVDDPKNWLIRCLHGDDQVQLTARDAMREAPVAPMKKPRKAKPKRGEQMKLFGDD